MSCERNRVRQEGYRPTTAISFHFDQAHLNYSRLLVGRYQEGDIQEIKHKYNK